MTRASHTAATLPELPSAPAHRGVDPVKVGTAFGILSALSYTGANVALRQVARHGDIDWSIWVSCLKALPAAVIAWGLIGWRAYRGLPALPPRRLVIPLLATGLMMQFAGNVMFLFALSLGGLALTVPLLFSTLILSGAWLGRTLLGEPITRRSAAAMALLILSIALLSAGANQATEAVAAESTKTASIATVIGGILAACVAGCSYGAAGVVIRRTVKQQVSLSATLVLLSSSGVVGLGLTSLWRMGPQQLLATPPDDFWMMLLAGLLNAIAFFSIGNALRHMPVTRVNLLNASQAAMCAAAGVIWFGEHMTLSLIVGTLLTILGLMLMEARKSNTPRLQSKDRF